MSHESHVSSIFLPFLQDNASFGHYKFFNCTVGKIIRLTGNNDNEKEEEDEIWEMESKPSVIRCNKIAVENGGIGINFGHVVTNGKTHPYRFQNCDINEIVPKPSK